VQNGYCSALDVISLSLLTANVAEEAQIRLAWCSTSKSLPLYVCNSGSLIPADGALGSCIELRDVLARLPGTSSMALALTSRGSTAEPVPLSFGAEG
jgi:hypothetical protein